MILSTTEFIPEREIEKILGIARGSTVRSRNVARDIVAQLKNIIGGEIEEYTKLQAYAINPPIGNHDKDPLTLFPNKNRHNKTINEIK